MSENPTPVTEAPVTEEPVTEEPVTEGAVGRRSPLLDPSWRYLDKPDYYAFTRPEVDRLHAQHDEFDAQRRADVVLALLVAGRDEPSYGYRVNNFRHSLQSATMVRRDGHDTEDIVVALLHDVGFLACPERHGAFAAELLGGYVSERNYWMLRHHQSFAAFELADEPVPAPGSRVWERWRGHEHFDWTYEFVRHYDVDAMNPDFEADPLESFRPLVQEIFTRPATRLTLAD